MDLSSWNTPKTSRGGHLQPTPQPSPDVEEGPLTPCGYCQQESPQGQGSKSNPLVWEKNVTLLQEQVKPFSALLQSNMDMTKASDVQQQNHNLQEENENLRNLVQETNDRLSRLQEEVIQLDQEYQKESSELKIQVQELTDLIETKEDEQNQLSINMQKALKAKETLERYLHSLPTEREHQDLKEKLRSKDDQFSRLHCQFAVVDIENQSLKRENKKASDSLQKLTQENTYLSSKLSMAEERLSRQEIRQKRIKQAKMNDPEVIMSERDEFEAENERLKNLIHIETAKFEAERRTKDEKVRVLTLRLNQAESRLSELSEENETEKSTNQFLRMDLSRSKGQLADMIEKVGAFEAEVENLKTSATDGLSDITETCTKLELEIQRILKDAKCITSVLAHFSSGQDVELADLLGLNELSLNKVATQNHSQLSQTELRTNLRQNLLTLKEMRKEISGVKRILSEKYAEKAGETMNSCVTQ